MILAGNQDKKPFRDLNTEMLGLKGELSEEEARKVMLTFFKNNLGIAVFQLLGITLAPIQILSLRAMFKRNYIMQIRTRGGSKSFEAGIYCILRSIFYPGTRIVIASANFRTSRRLLIEYIDKLLKFEGDGETNPGAHLARQCFGDLVKRQDAFDLPTWGGGYISSIPLTTETRGSRCDLLVLDEALLLSQVMIDEVLAPFLSSPKDAAQRIQLQQREDDMVRAGTLKSEERTIFENTSQMVMLSSASYEFEHLYKVYLTWLDFIEHPEKIDLEIDKETGEIVKKKKETELLEDRPTYSIWQLGWEAIPPTILNRKFIHSQKAILSDDSFLREYCGQFKSGNSGYFSPKKMNDCTIPDGENPCMMLRGHPDKKYILIIDPNYSKSRSADYFAMMIFEIDEERQEGCVVHVYQMVSSTLQNHIDYVNYLFQCFNIVLVMADAAGLDTFIDAINEDDQFRAKHHKKLSYITEWDSSKENQDYTEMLINAKKQYDVTAGCMVISQYSTSTLIQRMNSFLQAKIDHKQIWFASKCSTREDALEKMFHTNIPRELIKVRSLEEKLSDKDEMRKLEIRELMGLQDFFIGDVKAQTASIQVTSTSRGTQSFDLPPAARKSTDPNKPRRDGYSCLVMGCWATKIFFDLCNQPEEEIPEGFVVGFNLFHQ